MGELKSSAAAWKIVFGHHPIYSSGHYGTNQALIDSLTPLFQKYGVQLYINGHEHNYERTQPIQGTTYLITGIGGAQLRPVGRSPWTAFSTSRYGFSAIEIYTRPHGNHSHWSRSSGVRSGNDSTQNLQDMKVKVFLLPSVSRSAQR